MQVAGGHKLEPRAPKAEKASRTRSARKVSVESWDRPIKAMPRIKIEHKCYILVGPFEERRDAPGSDGVKTFLEGRSEGVLVRAACPT